MQIVLRSVRQPSVNHPASLLSEQKATIGGGSGAMPAA